MEHGWVDGWVDGRESVSGCVRAVFDNEKINEGQMMSDKVGSKHGQIG